MSSPAIEAQAIEEQTIAARLKSLQMRLAHAGLSDAQRFLLLSLFIGMFSGLLVVLFHISIDALTWTSLGALTGRFQYMRMLWPAIGAYVAVVIVRVVFPRAKGSGVNQTKMAIYTSDGQVSGVRDFDR
jgi:chloride channel protein, CIC family